MFSCSAREFYHVWTCLWLFFARPTSLAVLSDVCPQWVSMGLCPPDLPNDPPPGVAATVLGLVKDVGHPGTVFPTIAVILRRRLVQLSFSKKLCSEKVSLKKIDEMKKLILIDNLTQNQIIIYFMNLLEFVD